MKELKQADISIYINDRFDTVLKDTRIGHYGIVFGTIGSVCRQYGIKVAEVNGRIQLSAPKMRLMMLIEKLHFGRVRYYRN